MMNGLHGFACCLLLAAFGSSDALAQQPSAVPAAEDAEARAFVIDNKPWTGDFDAMLERRVIRVIVPYSRTLYFNDKGQKRASPPRPCATSSGTSTRSTARTSGRSPWSCCRRPATACCAKWRRG
jgi:hypothetical protein